MYQIFKQFIGFLVFTLSFQYVIAQDLCTPVGWATQNGGTTGGGTAIPITVSTLADLQTQAKSTGSKVIYVSGVVGVDVSTRVAVAANKTIIGMPGAKLIGGFDVKANNIIIRNMKIQGPGSVDVNGVDCINIDGANNVWIDHCDIYDGQDGNMDIVNGANYVAVTWCKFYYTSASSIHQFCNLLGNSDTKTTDRGKIKITMMYNWWTSGCVERMPRVRFGQVHVVNNLFSSTQASYCVRAGIEADILVESNYFDAVKTPIDLYQNNFTAVTQRNNVFNATTGNTLGSGTSFTPPYTLTIAPAANVKSLVSNATCGAGATMASPTSCGCGSTTVTYYALTSTSNPVAGGTITGAGTYVAGSVVTLTATPLSGYTFTGWTGDVTATSTTTTITMNANKTVVANFQAVTPVSYTLSAVSNPVGAGTITGVGSYTAGSTATVTATAATGYTFTGWTGDATATTASASVVMNANKSVTANFKVATLVSYTLTTTASPATGGTITGAGSYTSGSLVTLTATPATGYSFAGWSGDATGVTSPVTITMNSNKSVTATFQLISGGTTSTIRIEDNATTTTGLCSYDGVLSSNSGANNGKVINLTNSVAKGISWKINAIAGSYLVNFRYVNSSSSNTFSMKLMVNGVVINSAFPFLKTTGSAVFSNSRINLNLVNGSNIIRVESTAANATADIDWLEVTGNSPLPGNCLIARESTQQVIPDIDDSESIYPNPSNGKFAIAFNLKKDEKISINLYDAEGKLSNIISSKYFASGYHVEQYDMITKKPGVYNLAIIGEKNFKKTIKLVIL